MVYGCGNGSCMWWEYKYHMGLQNKRGNEMGYCVAGTKRMYGLFDLCWATEKMNEKGRGMD